MLGRMSVWMERVLFPSRARQLERDVHDVAICTMMHAAAAFRSERERMEWLEWANRKVQAIDFNARLDEAQCRIHAQLLRTLAASTSTQSMREVAGFAVETAPSPAPGAQRGRGVFVRGGDAPCGTVVAMYPGTAYGVDSFSCFVAAATERREGADEAEAEHLVSSMRRYDGTVLDGQLPPGCSSDSALAAGHLVNHPPAGERANVLPCAFDFHFVKESESDGEVTVGKRALPMSLRALVPCAVYDVSSADSDSGGGSIGERASRLVAAFTRRAENIGAAEQSDDTLVVPGLVLITLRDVACDEELLLNYRLHPMTEKPEWYTAVDEEEDRRVWGTSDASWRFFGGK